MGAAVVLAGLAFTAIAVLSVFAAVAVFFKIVLRLILLPLLLIKFIVMGLLMLVVGPVLFVVGLVVALFVGLVLAVPPPPFLPLRPTPSLLSAWNPRPPP